MAALFRQAVSQEINLVTQSRNLSASTGSSANCSRRFCSRLLVRARAPAGTLDERPGALDRGGGAGEGRRVPGGVIAVNLPKSAMPEAPGGAPLPYGTEVPGGGCRGSGGAAYVG